MNTKQRIEQAATRRFALEGYEGLSLAALAEDVGIKKASLYAHIDGKEQLFKQVVEAMAARYDDVSCPSNSFLKDFEGSALTLGTVRLERKERDERAIQKAIISVIHIVKRLLGQRTLLHRKAELFFLKRLQFSLHVSER